jgi:hypothetical protein
MKICEDILAQNTVQNVLSRLRWMSVQPQMYGRAIHVLELFHKIPFLRQNFVRSVSLPKSVILGSTLVQDINFVRFRMTNSELRRSTYRIVNVYGFI